MHRSLIITLLVASPACVTQDPTASVTTTEQASSHDDCPAGVPAALAPAADQDLAFVFAAEGVQKYTCNATAWVFVAPQADLFRGSSDHVIGTHYAGPTWEHLDGSTVVGARLAGATVDATTIPWLLLTAVGHNAVEGRMTGITAIQRLETEGGLAPAIGCDPNHLGATADVPYTANYFFYRTRREHPERNHRCGVI